MFAGGREAINVFLPAVDFNGQFAVSKGIKDVNDLIRWFLHRQWYSMHLKMPSMLSPQQARR